MTLSNNVAQQHGLRPGGLMDVAARERVSSPARILIESKAAFCFGMNTIPINSAILASGAGR